MSEVIKIFIASPGDVAVERELATRAIGMLDGRLSRLFNCSLHPTQWENFALTQGAHDRFQDKLLPWVDEAQIFLGIVHKRYGTPARPGSTLSGTEEEFNRALQFRKSLQILTYFRKQRGRVGPEALKVRELRERLNSAGLLVKDYDSPDELLPRLLMDLMELVIMRQPDWQHRDALREFFLLGRGYNQDGPRVLICVPPMFGNGRAAEEAVRADWHTRLMPNVVYEDWKAVQRLEGAIRRIGVRGVKAVTTNTPDARASNYNKIWLCVPRNEIAKARLSQTPEAAFRLGELQDDGRRALIWRNQDGGEVVVRSPLDRYLRRRGPHAGDSEWEPTYSDVVARDFAVVARFPDSSGDLGRPDFGREFWEYFVFGVRGLGTWGAAWYMYHRANELAGLVRKYAGPRGEVQLLLEVTFAANRIVKVEPVMEKEQAYFDDQLGEAVVDRVCAQWSHLVGGNARRKGGKRSRRH
jgi:hypothetical protein